MKIKNIYSNNMQIENREIEYIEIILLMQFRSKFYKISSYVEIYTTS